MLALRIIMGIKIGSADVQVEKVFRKPTGQNPSGVHYSFPGVTLFILIPQQDFLGVSGF
jgi:hypothetical protein